MRHLHFHFRTSFFSWWKVKRRTWRTRLNGLHFFFLASFLSWWTPAPMCTATKNFLLPSTPMKFGHLLSPSYMCPFVYHNSSQCTVQLTVYTANKTTICLTIFCHACWKIARILWSSYSQADLPACLSQCKSWRRPPKTEPSRLYELLLVTFSTIVAQR